MTKEQQYVVIGRTVEEYSQTRESLTAKILEYERLEESINRLRARERELQQLLKQFGLECADREPG